MDVSVLHISQSIDDAELRHVQFASHPSALDNLDITLAGLLFVNHVENSFRL